MNPGEQPDMSALFAQAQQMQQQLMAAQAQIVATKVTGQAGGGLVTATVTGGGELLSLTIDPTDVETLQDLVIGAVADASRQAGEMASRTLGPLADLAGGGLPGLPGQ